MGERKYCVKDRHFNIVADNMTLETAMLLCRAMFNAYFEDNIELSISEMPRTEGECNNEKIH